MKRLVETDGIKNFRSRVPAAGLQVQRWTEGLWPPTGRMSNNVRQQDRYNNPNSERRQLALIVRARRGVYLVVSYGPRSTGMVKTVSDKLRGMRLIIRRTDVFLSFVLNCYYTITTRDERGNKTYIILSVVKRKWTVLFDEETPTPLPTVQDTKTMHLRNANCFVHKTYERTFTHEQL